MIYFITERISKCEELLSSPTKRLKLKTFQMSTYIFCNKENTNSRKTLTKNCFGDSLLFLQIENLIGRNYSSICCPMFTLASNDGLLAKSNKAHTMSDHEIYALFI